jgi:branched-chain amino acid aminotransferase
MGRVVYKNGSYIDEAEVGVSIYDSALQFGDMVFEMTRSFNRDHFLLDRHLDRLYEGLKILRIDPGLSKDELFKVCMETTGVNDPFIPEGDEHRLMINVSRGPLGIYSHMFENPGPTIIVADFPLSWTVSGLAYLIDEGINVVVPSQRAIPATLMDPKIKNRSRLFYQMANIQVANVKGTNNMALLLDPDGRVTEGTGNNFFIVKEGKVITPKGENVLRGISREFVLEICRTLSIPTAEEDMEVFDVYAADEAFVTATPFCMLPVVSLDGVAIGDQKYESAATGAFGPVSARIAAAWSENAGLDFIEQLRGFTGSSPTQIAPSPYQFKPSSESKR